MRAPVVCLLGLGEAGSAFARDLVAAGVGVRAYDPAVAAPESVVGCTDEAHAVRGADLVISLNSADDSLVAARNAASGCAPGSLWAEANSSSPTRKREVAMLLPEHVVVADVALMSTVPGRGLRVPMAASGPGAQAYADLLAPLGATVDLVGQAIGDAAARKLLRSVFFKGLAAAVTESLAAARAAGLEAETRAEIARELADATADTVTRLEEGSRLHALRRSHEMAAAVEMVEGLGVPARVSAASRDWLRDLVQDLLV